MAIKYAVLFGVDGVEEFGKLPMARAFAKKKANELGEEVTVDKVTTYPDAKPGQVDWSQKYFTSVKPTKKK